jgi:hypothetical protein
MPIRTLELAIAGAALLILLPSSAPAQSTSLFADAIRGLTPGSDIEVVDATGRSSKGRLQMVEGDAIVLRKSDDRTMRFEAEDVRTLAIREADSVVGGLLVGAAFGAGGGAVVGALASKDAHVDFIKASDVWLATLGGGLIGVAIGGAADAAKRNTTVVYRSTATVALLPVASPHGGGMLVQFCW